jgi:hypothetical protein
MSEGLLRGAVELHLTQDSSHEVDADVTTRRVRHTNGDPAPDPGFVLAARLGTVETQRLEVRD